MMKSSNQFYTAFWVAFNSAQDNQPQNQIKITSLVAQTIKHLPAMWETWVRSLGQEDLLEEEMATHFCTLGLENPMDGEAWQATVHGVTKSWTQLRDFTFIFTPKTSLKLLLDTLILVTFQNLPPALINKKLTHFIWRSPKNTTRTQQKSSNHSF